MATIKICDKCKKQIKESKELERKSWQGDMTYNIVGPGTRMKINKQSVLVSARISLSCGDPLELCYGCGWKIVRKFINEK